MCTRYARGLALLAVLRTYRASYNGPVTRECPVGTINSPAAAGEGADRPEQVDALAAGSRRGVSRRPALGRARRPARSAGGAATWSNGCASVRRARRGCPSPLAQRPSDRCNPQAGAAAPAAGRHSSWPRVSGGFASGRGDSSRQETPRNQWSVASVQVLRIQGLVEWIRAGQAAG